MAIHCTTATIKDELGKSGKEVPHMRNRTGSPTSSPRLSFAPSLYFVTEVTAMLLS